MASVRRLGVIMFRLAMCISVLRLTEDGNYEDDITCLDIDYQTAKTITLTLIQHNAKVFSTLPSTPQPTMAYWRTSHTVDTASFNNEQGRGFNFAYRKNGGKIRIL